VLALGIALGAVLPANAVEAKLEGAWIQDGTCDETFARAGKGISFKKPINVFAPAFIITGNRLRTPTASCSIKSVKPRGNRRVLSLQCSTAVAELPRMDHSSAISTSRIRLATVTSAARCRPVRRQGT
jgi:hypothetical protein